VAASVNFDLRQPPTTSSSRKSDRTPPPPSGVVAGAAAATAAAAGAVDSICGINTDTRRARLALRRVAD